jgi:hypothetical protein
VPKVKYNVKDVEEGGGDFVQAPKGLYIGKIVQIDVGESKSSGQEMFTVRLELTKDAQGKKLKENYGNLWFYAPTDPNENPAWAPRLREFVLAVGLKMSGTLDTDALIDKEVQVSVRPDKDLDGDYRASVGKLMAMPEESEDDDDNDEDAEDEDAGAEASADDDEDDEDDEEEGEADWAYLETLDRTELKAFNKDNELEVKVTRGMPDDALRAALAEAAGIEVPEPDGEDEDEDEEGGEAQDYSDWDLAQLKAECKERGLTTTGNTKAIFVKRLEKDDASAADPF